MSSKKNGRNAQQATAVVSTQDESEVVDSTPVSDDLKIYSYEEKKELIGKVLSINQQIDALKSRIDELQTKKSDMAFELQKAFGEKKFSVGGVIMRVVRYTGRNGGETTWRLKSVDTNVEEQF